MSNFEHGLGLIRGEADPRDYVYGISTAALPEENGCSTVWMTGEHGRGRCFTANLRLRRTGDAG